MILRRRVKKVTNNTRKERRDCKREKVGASTVKRFVASKNGKFQRVGRWSFSYPCIGLVYNVLHLGGQVSNWLLGHSRRTNSESNVLGTWICGKHHSRTFVKGSFPAPCDMLWWKCTTTAWFHGLAWGPEANLCHCCPSRDDERPLHPYVWWHFLALSICTHFVYTVRA